jgi:hypothetical protein
MLAEIATQGDHSQQAWKKVESPTVRAMEVGFIAPGADNHWNLLGATDRLFGEQSMQSKTARPSETRGRQLVAGIPHVEGDTSLMLSDAIGLASGR